MTGEPCVCKRCHAVRWTCCPLPLCDECAAIHKEEQRQKAQKIDAPILVPASPVSVTEE